LGTKAVELGIQEAFGIAQNLEIHREVNEIRTKAAVIFAQSEGR
jgi:hypothetical protein